VCITSLCSSIVSCLEGIYEEARDPESKPEDNYDVLPNPYDALPNPYVKIGSIRRVGETDQTYETMTSAKENAAVNSENNYEKMTGDNKKKDNAEEIEDYVTMRPKLDSTDSASAPIPKPRASSPSSKSGVPIPRPRPSAIPKTQSKDINRDLNTPQPTPRRRSTEAINKNDAISPQQRNRLSYSGYEVCVFANNRNQNNTEVIDETVYLDLTTIPDLPKQQAPSSPLLRSPNDSNETKSHIYWNASLNYLDIPETNATSTDARCGGGEGYYQEPRSTRDSLANTDGANSSEDMYLDLTEVTDLQLQASQSAKTKRQSLSVDGYVDVDKVLLLNQPRMENPPPPLTKYKTDAELPPEPPRYLSFKSCQTSKFHKLQDITLLWSKSGIF